MKQGFIVLLLLISFGTIRAQEKKSKTMDPSFKFSEKVYNFGTVKQGEDINYEFVFKNIGKAPLLISDISSTCGCSVPEWSKEPVLQNNSGVIKVSFDTKGKLGLQDRVFTIYSNVKGEPEKIHLKGNIEP